MVTVSMGIGASKQSSTRKLVQTAIINALNRSTQSCAQQAAGEQNIIITGNNNKIQNVTLSQMSKIIGGCLNSQEVKQEFMNTLQQNLKDIAEHKHHAVPTGTSIHGKTCQRSFQPSRSIAHQCENRFHHCYRVYHYCYCTCCGRLYCRKIRSECNPSGSCRKICYAGRRWIVSSSATTIKDSHAYGNTKTEKK